MRCRASLGAVAWAVAFVFASIGCDGAEGSDDGRPSGAGGASGGVSGAAAGGTGAGSGGAAGDAGQAGTGTPGGASGAGGTGAIGGASSGGAQGGAGAAGDAGAGGAGSGGSGGSNGGALRVLAFSRTMVFRHESIGAGHAALTTIAAERGFELESSEDVASISDAVLSEKDVLVFLSTSGDVLDAAAEGALMRFIQAGGGFVGVHAASDTEYDFAFYGGLVGAYFNAHPDIQPATIVVEDATHPATAHLAATWARTDEWYGFRENPRANVRVLLRLDETSYDPGLGAMGDDHPIAWAHEYEGGRAFYTALGHTAESYDEPEFREHLAGAIAWAGGLAN
jgi:cytochrome c